jgi:hypothetical protein
MRLSCRQLPRSRAGGPGLHAPLRGLSLAVEADLQARLAPCIDDRAYRAAFERLVHELMPIESRTVQRDENVTRLQRSRVRDDVADHLIGIP